MDLEKLIALLKEKFQGVRMDAIEQLALMLSMTAKDENAVKQLVDGLTSTEVVEFEKKFQATLDTARTNAIKTNEENLRKKFEFVEKEKKPAKEEERKEKEEEKNTLLEQIASLKTLVEDLVSERKTASFREIVAKQLDEKGVDKAFYNAILAGRSFSSDEEVAQFVEETNKSYSSVVESITKKTLEDKRPPLSGSLSKEDNEAFIEAAKAYGQSEGGSNSFNVKKF